MNKISNEKTHPPSNGWVFIFIDQILQKDQCEQDAQYTKDGQQCNHFPGHFTVIAHGLTEHTEDNGMDQEGHGENKGDQTGRFGTEHTALDRGKESEV